MTNELFYKRKSFIIRSMLFKSAVVLMCIFAVTLSGCGLFGSNDDNTTMESTVYTIMYYDGEEVQTISVKNGDVYSIETPLPSKEGYDFIGLYDSEVGGTQYVNATGVSVSPFSDNRNITLYPQFKAQEYTVTLDYGEATAAGERALTAEYGSIFPALPGNLQIANKYYMLFQGWYTEEDCKGIQISDSDGISSIIFDEELASTADSNRNITLYAGFKKQTYSVTFYDTDRTTILKIAEVEHGETISDVKPQKTSDGQSVLTWNNAFGTDYSNSVITGDVSLYVGTCLPDKVLYDDTLRTGEYKLAGSGRYTVDEIMLPEDIVSLTDEGYTKLEITINFNIKEVDDCYQLISLYDSTGVDIYSETVEHGGTNKDTSWKTHSFTCKIDLSKLRSATLYFKCQAENKIFKDFYIGTVTAVVTATR